MVSWQHRINPSGMQQQRHQASEVKYMGMLFGLKEVAFGLLLGGLEGWGAIGVLCSPAACQVVELVDWLQVENDDAAQVRQAGINNGPRIIMPLSVAESCAVVVLLILVILMFSPGMHQLTRPRSGFNAYTTQQQETQDKHTRTTTHVNESTMLTPHLSLSLSRTHMHGILR